MGIKFGKGEETQASFHRGVNTYRHWLFSSTHQQLFINENMDNFLKGGKDMGICRCGTCGELANDDRDFRPGHDMKLRKKIEDKVGGLFKLEDLVDAAEKYSRGEIESAKFTKRVREIFSS